MFGDDFYPTKRETIEKMVLNSVLHGKVILEPSAGSGNIVDYLNGAGAKEVLACEIDSRLRAILGEKCRIVQNDFLELTAEAISHVDMIIMNPPFSTMEKHILHAWEIAPAGCEIISLCNKSLLDNRYSEARRKVAVIVQDNGSYSDFGSCFEDAERRTNVGVSCIHIFKTGTASNEFDGYFDLTSDEEEKCEVAGLMSYNYVRDVVGRFTDAVLMFDDVEAVNARMSSLISPIDGTMNIRFGAFNCGRDGDNKKTTRETFKKELQKSAWKSIFAKFDIGRYVTTGVLADINKYVETQIHVPFSMKNVYLMIEMIIGTSASRMDKVLVEAFEKICSFSDDNSTGGEGWKTNSDYMLNKRFIKPYVCDNDTRWPEKTVKISYSGHREFEDIFKALCHLTGSSFEDYIPLDTFFSCPFKLERKSTGVFVGGYSHSYHRWEEAQRAVESFAKSGIEVKIEKTCQEWGQWVDWGFFRVRGYKKGTAHFEFKDDKVLEMFNLKVASIKGWSLPKSTKKSRSKTEGVEVY